MYYDYYDYKDNIPVTCFDEIDIPLFQSEFSKGKEEAEPLDTASSIWNTNRKENKKKHTGAY